MNEYGEPTSAQLTSALVGIVAVGILVAFLAYIAVTIGAQIDTRKTQIKLVCNTDHLDLNMTQFCADNGAINATLWEMQHKP